MEQGLSWEVTAAIIGSIGLVVGGVVSIARRGDLTSRIDDHHEKLADHGTRLAVEEARMTQVERKVDTLEIEAKEHTKELHGAVVAVLKGE